MILSNVFFSFFYYATTFLFPFITIPIVSSALGKEAFGEYSLLVSYSFLLMLVTDLGFNVSGPRYVARRKLKYKFKILTIISLLKFYVIGLFFLIGFFLLPVAYWVVFLLPIGGVIYPHWFLAALHYSKLSAFFSVVGRVAALILTYFLVDSPRDTVLAVSLQASPYYFSAIVFFLRFRNSIEFGFKDLFRFRLFRYFLVSTSRVYASSLATSVYTTCNTIFAGLVVPIDQVGVFYVVERFVRSSIAFFNSTNPFFLSYFSVSVFSRRFLFFYTLFAFVFCFSIFLFLKFFGHQFWGVLHVWDIDLAICYASLYFWVVPIVLCSNFFGVNILLVNGFDTYFSVILIIASMVYLSFFFVFKGFFGQYFLIYLNVTVEFFVLLLILTIVGRLFYVRKLFL